MGGKYANKWGLIEKESQSMNCVICKKPFMTNYPHKLTCSDSCGVERKRLKKIETYYSENGYQAKKNKPVIKNTFLKGSGK